MIHITKTLSLIALFFLFSLFTAAMLYAADVTITGEVNDSYQILANGKIYEIADTPKGNELAENHVNAKVEVTGSIEEQDDVRVITVKSYQLLAE